MYFRDKDDTNIDDDFKKKYNFVFDKKILLYILGSLFLLGIILIIVFSKDNEKTYTLELNGDTDISLYVGEEYIEPGYTLYDSDGVNHEDMVKVSGEVDTNNVGEYKFIYSYDNMEYERNIKVVVKPEEATRIFLKGDTIIYLELGKEYVEPGYQVIDTNSDNLTDSVIVDGIIDTTKSGTYTLVYSVTNSHGVTVNTKRTIIVINCEIDLKIANDGYTNSKVDIIYTISDNYFNYVVLPDGTKSKNMSGTYSVTDNGIYTFTSYNKRGDMYINKVEVSNIDKDKPYGSCSGEYGDGKSTIKIIASDKSGIEKFVIDGKNYTDKSITINKEIENVNITIYDKAGNSNNISCKLKSTVKHYDADFSYHTFSGKTSIPYWINIPEGATSGMALVIFLPGDGEINNKNKVASLPFVEAARSYTKEKFILIAGVPIMASWTTNGIPETVMSLIDDTVKKYEIDKTRIYISGYSRGTIGTWYLIDHNPHFFAAAIPASCCPSNSSPNNYIYTPIIAVSGTVDYEEGYNSCMTSIVNKIKNAGGTADKWTYKGYGHGGVQQVMEYDKLFDWMFKQINKDPR